MILHLPASEEGMKILAYETPVKISVNDFKDKYATLIKKFAIGGIQEPVCITEQYKEANQPDGIPVLIYTDKNDQSKRVTIWLDSANGNLFRIFVWQA